MTGSHRADKLNRREFLAGAATAAAFTVVRPSSVRGTGANATIELGLLGCGGRGQWIVRLFEKHGKYRFVACADYYPDRADQVGEKCRIDASRRYTTLSAYRKLLDDKIDAVVIETPPYFHPEQAAAAVDAGKHVYLAKPIAVDVPGCKTIAEAGRKATAKKLAFLVDFQTRANRFYREAARRIHAGELGRLVCGDARYPCGVMDKKPPRTPEDRLREWYNYRAFSGDFIVEQSIHALDVATWFVNDAPLAAVGTGGSKGLRLYGDDWDHFNLIYRFPKEFVLSFYSVQMAHGAPNEIVCRIYGSQGTVHSDYFSGVFITGPRPWEGARFTDLYDSGTAVNIAEFYEAVTAGRFDNPTVAPSVRSNLTAILGRTAAYRGEVVTWEDLMKSDERLEADLKGLKS
ncbi:MAG TPA: Gfo/Idh/MocA family oxidoreductase [Phycisphaerae bacterium]|nr:Gfo/Idh/MocA family oxidoreductase [Phycisphaerae bacterium]